MFWHTRWNTHVLVLHNRSTRTHGYNGNSSSNKWQPCWKWCRGIKNGVEVEISQRYGFWFFPPVTLQSPLICFAFCTAFYCHWSKSNLSRASFYHLWLKKGQEMEEKMKEEWWREAGDTWAVMLQGTFLRGVLICQNWVTTSLPLIYRTWHIMDGQTEQMRDIVVPLPASKWSCRDGNVVTRR